MPAPPGGGGRLVEIMERGLEAADLLLDPSSFGGDEWASRSSVAVAVAVAVGLTAFPPPSGAPERAACLSWPSRESARAA